MALVIDNRATVNGPGVHALIVGVSNYQALPDHDDPPREATWFLNKLTSGALSAFAFHEAVAKNNLRLPLKTVRLLLSPHAIELAANPALAASGAAHATRAAFEQDARDWREDAKSNRDDMTIFLFSGHGIQRGPEEGVLLLEDFLTPNGAPPLAKCFEVGNIKNGMAPSDTFTEVARTQFYFVDACLTRPETQKKFVDPQVPQVFGPELNSVDDRDVSLLFSTVDGAISLGRDGKPSHFAEALTQALRNAADETRQDPNGNILWPVTSLAIKTALDMYYEKNQLGTKVKIGGFSGSPVLRFLPGPPSVDISVRIRPDDIGVPFGVWLFDDNNNAVPNYNPINKTDFTGTVTAGMYRVQVDCARLNASPYRSGSMFITQKGPWPWLHNLSNLMRP